MLRYAITDRTRFAGEEPARWKALAAQAHALAKAGVEYIQLREKDLAAEDLERLARQVMAAVREVGGPGRTVHWTRVLVNGRPDVAVAARADGVHLRSTQGAGMTLQMRELFAGAGLPEPVVSVACHTLREVQAAREAGVDLALYGPVFGKVVANGVLPGMGLDALRVVCRAGAPMPVLALGGVTMENAEECEAAGAAGVAGIRLFLEPESVASDSGSGSRGTSVVTEEA